MRKTAISLIGLAWLALGAIPALGQASASGGTIVNIGPAAPITMSLAPSTASVMVNSTQRFVLTLSNDFANRGANLALSGAGCSSTACGTLDLSFVRTGQTITYTAPSSVPSNPSVILTATSIQDGSTSTASITTITSTAPPITLNNTNVGIPKQAAAASNTFPFTATKGRLLVVPITGGAGTVISSVVDNLGQVYASSGCPITMAGGYADIYYLASALPGVTSITINQSSHPAANIDIAVIDADGGSSSPLDGTPGVCNAGTGINNGGTNSSVSSFVGPTVCASTGGGLIVGVIVVFDQATGVSAPFTFSLLPRSDGVATYRNPAAGIFTPTWTMTAGGGVASTIAAFRSGTQPATVSVSASPQTANVQVNATQKFTALVNNDNANAGVTWTLAGAGCSGATCGTITAATGSGVPATYTAPGSVPSPASVSVTATSVTDGTKTATTTVTVGAVPVLGVAVAPLNASTTAGGSAIPFTATVSNDSLNRGVTWTVTGGNCTGGACGTVAPTSSASGAAVLYTPPATVSSTLTVSVAATSVSDTSKSAAAAVIVSPKVGPFSCTLPNCPAFPGAQGGGAAAVGGRGTFGGSGFGGVVYNITTLSDTSNAGCSPFNSDSVTCSMRDCLTANVPRYCIPRVAGLSTPNSQIFIGSPYVTWEGHAAPGEFILGGPNLPQTEAGIRISTHDTIFRYITYSPDSPSIASGPSTGTNAYYIANTQDFNNIVDHCTSRWAGNKEAAIFAGFTGEFNSDFSMQWCALYEPHQGHPVGPSISEQGILSNTQNSHNVDFHHNILVNFSHRLPEYNHSPARWTNNWTHNWGFYALAALGATQTDVIGNRWSCANLNASGAQPYPIHSSDGSIPGSLPGTPSFYVAGNIGCGHTTPNTDQYGDLTRQITGENGDELGTFPSTWKRGTPLAASNSFPITVDPAANLDSTLLPTVGNSAHLDCTGNLVSHRDPQDTRIINQLKAGANGGFWPNGTTCAGNNCGSLPTPQPNWTDTPVVNGFTKCTESMHDGIPDAWKTKYGLSLSDPILYKRIDKSTGLTAIEDYYGGLVPGVLQ